MDTLIITEEMFKKAIAKTMHDMVKDNDGPETSEASLMMALAVPVIGGYILEALQEMVAENLASKEGTK